jgi:hypothetical protein
MSSRKRSSSSRTALKSLVTIAYAEDADLAKQYKQLLIDNDIPAAIRVRGAEDSSIKGVPVMVPEDLIDEAHLIIEEHNSMSDFYNVAFGDEQPHDYFSFDSDEELY